MKISDNMTLIRAAQILVEDSQYEEFTTLIGILLALATKDATSEELAAIAVIYKELGEMYDAEREQIIKKSLTFE